MKVGFVGTGAITEAMVTGMLTGSPLASEIIISPRNADVAARLAEKFPAARIAADNQAVVDACEILFLAIRPQIAEDVVRALSFPKGQVVVSVIAAVDRGTLIEWIGRDVRLSQAVPLPFVARREGVTAIYPPDRDVASLFSSLGTAVECDTKEEYDLLAAASAMMATYFGIMDRATGWLTDKGMPERRARAYVAPLFASLSQTALKSSEIPFEDMSREFATKGGLNEQVLSDFDRDGGMAALTAALDRVLMRITNS